MAAIREIRVTKVATVKAADIATGKPVKAIVFRLTKPLTKELHDAVSKKLRDEETQAGVRIILMPYSCELGEYGEEQMATGTGESDPCGGLAP